jgi:hypothetical protein
MSPKYTTRLILAASFLIGSLEANAYSLSLQHSSIRS